MNDDLTDTVAKAIYVQDYQGQPNWKTWESLDDDGKKSYREMARVAMAAIDEAQEGQG